MKRPENPSNTEGGFTPFGEFSMQTKEDSRSATIGRRLRGDFSDVDPNVLRIATVCMVTLCGAIGLAGMYVGLGMVDNAMRDIPAKYIDSITRAAVGSIITMSAIASGTILAVSATRYWPRNKSG